VVKVFKGVIEGRRGRGLRAFSPLVATSEGGWKEGGMKNPGGKVASSCTLEQFTNEKSV